MLRQKTLSLPNNPGVQNGEQGDSVSNKLEGSDQHPGLCCLTASSPLTSVRTLSKSIPGSSYILVPSVWIVYLQTFMGLKFTHNYAHNIKGFF